MVIVFEAQAALTPVGKPVAEPIPVAPVVLCVILVKAVLIHKVGVEDAEPTVLSAETVTVRIFEATAPVQASQDTLAKRL